MSSPPRRTLSERPATAGLSSKGNPVIAQASGGDRESMLWALDEPPTEALAELRGVLLSEHEWRVRDGLI